MDGDDVSRLDRLHFQVEYLDNNQDVGVLGSRVQMIDQDSRNISREYPFFQTNEQIRNVLPYRDPLPHPALMFRKSTLLSVQGYKYGNFSVEYEMYIRMARNPDIKFYNLDRILLEYRRHSTQLTSTVRMKSQYADISGYLYTEFLRTHSPKYIFGMFILHPLVRKIRLACRKLLRGSDL